MTAPSLIEIPLRQARCFRPLFLAASALTLIACADESAVPDGRPRAERAASLYGAVWSEETIVSADGGARWAQETIADFRRIAPADAPARIEPLDTSSCVMRQPVEGESVRHVFAGRGAGAAPLYLLNDSGAQADAASDQLHVVNIAVTETRAPVHLVLASETGVIWNLLTAEGARIPAITIISGGGAGVAGAPPETTIEALYGEALTRCAVSPARQPQADWGLMRRAANAASPERALLDARKGAAAAYEAWFSKWYGTAGRVETVSAMQLGAVLIGPSPATKADRVPMRPLAGATLKLSLADRLIIGSPRDYEAAVSRRAANTGS